MGTFLVCFYDEQPERFREFKTLPKAHEIVEAADELDAVDLAARRCSVAAVKRGMFVAVKGLYGASDGRFKVSYDGKPMNDNNTATDAKLVIEREETVETVKAVYDHEWRKVRSG